jgi:pyruvate-formate lyase-activating enzyme
MTYNKDVFCTMPWSSILILPSGDFKICCFTGHIQNDGKDSHGVAVDDDGNVMNVLTHSIKEAMNSKWHKELRKYQSEGKRHPICKVCWDRDDAATTQNIPSTSLRVVRSYYQTQTNQDRIGGLAMKGAVQPETAASLVDEDFNIDMMPLSLDIRFSNLCNEKCIMCNTLYSNQWYEDHIALTGKNTFQAGPKTYKINKSVSPSGKATYSSDMDVWNNDPRWWKQFDELAPHLRHIYITGGEPFVQPTHDIFIQKLVEGGYAKDIVIEYDTNLTAMNPKILTLLKNFKDQIFRISVDDVNEAYGLIRFPGKFETVVKNIELMKEYDLHDRIVEITTCIGIYSVFSPINLYNYFQPLGYEKYFIRILRSPVSIDMVGLPKSIKQKIIERYEASNLPKKYHTHVVGYLKNNLDAVTNQEAVIKIKNFVGYMDSLDRLRGTDWKKTFPEINKLLFDFLSEMR